MNIRPRAMTSIVAMLAIAGSFFTPSDGKRSRMAAPSKTDRESRRSSRPYVAKEPYTTHDFARIAKAEAKRARKAGRS